MKVLIVPSWYEARPGAQLGSFFREQALALKKMGCDIIVADATFQSMHNLKGKKVFGIHKKDDEGLLTYSYLIPSFGLMRMPKLAVSVYASNLERIIRSVIKDGHKLDVIHAHSFFCAGAAVTRLGKKYGIPVVVTEHSSAVISKKLDAQKIDLLVEAVENSDRFICVGNGLKKAVEEYTRTEKQISIIPNMVDKRFTYKEAKDSDTFSFVSIGNLIQRKRFDLTIQAFASVFKGNDNVMLTIIGDGPLKESLRALSVELGVEKQVVFAGRLARESVAQELQRSNVFVLASDFETFGVVYIEAMACGLPVIGTRNGGADDIITDKCGYLVNVDDVHQLAEAMNSVYESYPIFERSSLVVDCQRRFGEHIVCERIIDIYRTTKDSFKGN